MMTQLQDPHLQKYLSKLKKQLSPLPKAEQDDVLKELESHVYEELQQGAEPLAILQRLGAPESYARSYLEQYGDALRSHGDLPEHARFMFRQAVVPVLLACLVFITIMQLNTLYIFGEVISKGISGWVVAQMLLMSLPAMIVLAIPIMALFIVPLYIYRLRGSRPGDTLRTPRVWLLTLLTGLVLSGTGFALQEYVVPAANRQTVEILKDMMNEPGRRKGEPDLQFMDNPDVRSMSLGESFSYLDRNPEAKLREYKDYYNKFSLPLTALSFAFFGLLTASLMLSGLFQPLYTLIGIGFVLPISLYYFIYSLTYDDSFSPLTATLAPHLVIGGLSGVFLLGLVLQLPRKSQEF